MTPRGLSAASQSYKERRDLYKMKSSGVKGRESVQGPPSMAANVDESSQFVSSQAAAATAGPSSNVNNYSELISRIEKNLGGGNGPSVDMSASKEIAEASGESDEKERPAAAASTHEPRTQMPDVEESLARDETAPP